MILMIYWNEKQLSTTSLSWNKSELKKKIVYKQTSGKQQAGSGALDWMNGE